MPPEQILIGSATAAMCLAGLCHQGWLLERTRKGRRLAERFGESTGAWMLRLLLALGLGFGVLLAAGIINPVRYPAASARQAH
jgi:hypothetical protein